MFNFFKISKEPKGLIAFYSLEDFWLNDFSEEERTYIVKTYQPMEVGVGVGLGLKNQPKNSLVEGNISSSSESAATFLSNIAGWFDNPRDRDIARRLIDKSLSLLEKSKNLVDLHYALTSAITIYYKDRADELVMEKIIDLCYKQIEISKELIPYLRKELYLTKNESLPIHKGYEQLAIILKKEGKFEEVIKISKKAKKEGWAGDWDKRIEFAQKKLKK